MLLHASRSNLSIVADVWATFHQNSYCSLCVAAAAKYTCIHHKEVGFIMAEEKNDRDPKSPKPQEADSFDEALDDHTTETDKPTVSVIKTGILEKPHGAFGSWVENGITY